MRDLLELGKLGIVLLLGICAMTGCGVSTETRSPVASTNDRTTEFMKGTSVGQIAPDFDLEKTDGTRISFNDLRGNPAVLVFWSAWCPACKEEAPHLNSLAEEYGAKGIKVIGINIGESDARVAEGIRDFGITYTVAKDKDASVAKSYNVIGTPTILFINKNGEVRYVGNELPKNYTDLLESILQG